MNLPDKILARIDEMNLENMVRAQLHSAIISYFILDVTPDFLCGEPLGFFEALRADIDAIIRRRRRAAEYRRRKKLALQASGIGKPVSPPPALSDNSTRASDPPSLTVSAPAPSVMFGEISCNEAPACPGQSAHIEPEEIPVFEPIIPVRSFFDAPSYEAFHHSVNDGRRADPFSVKSYFDVFDENERNEYPEEEDEDYGDYEYRDTPAMYEDLNIFYSRRERAIKAAAAKKEKHIPEEVPSGTPDTDDSGLDNHEKHGSLSTKVTAKERIRNFNRRKKRAASFGRKKRGKNHR